MSKYDDLFDETAPNESVFADKSALDPLADPEGIVARDAQEKRLARLLNGVHEGYLPTTISVYGPPGTGKTMTTRRVCREFATRHESVAVEYVNLKECRTLFSAANEILVELTGERKQAYEGFDRAFGKIWTALEDYPEWTILVLDEIDHVRHDSNYDPNDFFYRLLRGEGKLKRDLHLSLMLCSNELLDVDLRLDSRVQSAMSNEEVFFPPYDPDTLGRVLEPRLDRAYREGTLSEEVRSYGVHSAANRWGDARKALTLFRQAGESTNERGGEQVTETDIDTNLEATEREAVIEKLLALPLQHMLVLDVLTLEIDRHTGDVIQPVATSEIQRRYEELPEKFRIGSRAIREIVADLETMGLVETEIDSRGRSGRVKQVKTSFEPKWVSEASETYITQHREQFSVSSMESE